MALGKRCGSSLKSKRVIGDEELGLGYVRYARAFRRKRILISNHFQGFAIDLALKTPWKKMCGERLGWILNGLFSKPCLRIFWLVTNFLNLKAFDFVSESD